MGNSTFKPFAIGDRVISEADGPGTVVDILTKGHYLYPVSVQMDSGHKYGYTNNGQFFASGADTAFDIRHMSAEELQQYPKP